MPLREETGRRLATHLPAPNPPHLVTHAANPTHPVPRYALSLPQPTPLHPSRHRLTVSLVGRREGTGLLTSLPSLCFGPSVHASGRQGQGPARFLVPSREPRGPSPGAPPPSAPLTPFTRRRLAAGVMRGVRNGPSFFRPITALRRPCRRNRAKEVTAFHSFPPSLRSGVSLPFPLPSVRYALRSLRSLSFFACHVIPALRPRGRNRDGTEGGVDGTEVRWR